MRIDSNLRLAEIGERPDGFRIQHDIAAMLYYLVVGDEVVGRFSQRDLVVGSDMYIDWDEWREAHAKHPPEAS